MEPRSLAAAALVLPPPELSTCVRAYYWRHHRPGPGGAAGHGQTCVPPGPYPGLVWMVEGRAHLVECAGRPVHQELPPVFVGGPRRHPYRSDAITAYRSFGIVFQPAALSLLIGAPMGPWLDRVAPAGELLPADWLPWLDAMAALPGEQDRIALASDFLRPRWAAVTPARTPWTRLAEAAWRRPMQHLAMAAMNWSQRHFQRRTRQLTGLRAGEVERLIRCERALLALRDGGASLAEVAAAHGYADQAHFTREVRAFYGVPPAAMMRRIDQAAQPGDWLLRLRPQAPGDDRP